MNLTAATLAAALLATAAGARPASQPPAAPQCFRSSSYQSFRPVGDHAMNIRVNVHDYYRIEFEGSCSMITSPGAFLITQVRGSDLICGPLDWDLKVGEPGSGGIATACLVKSQRLLSAEEAAAIPPKEKP